MKFKKGDKVRVIGKHRTGKEGIVSEIRPNTPLTVFVKGIDEYNYKWETAFSENELELIEKDKSIRTFDTGATRDTDQNKLDYIKALSPEVLEYYVTYIGKHRQQPDGSIRDWDNWKMGISSEVYLSSLFRHIHATWMLLLGHKVKDNHGEVNLTDALCGIIFNAQGILYETLREQKNEKKS